MRGRTCLSAAIALILALGSARADIVTGLMASYPMDGNANDISGNGNNGTIIGGLTPTTDRLGTPNAAYEFNGVDSYIRVTSSPSLSTGITAITQAAWVLYYGESLVGNGFNPVIMKSVTTENAFMYRMIAGPTAFGAAFNNWNTHTSVFVSTPLNEWHHVATVFDGSTLRFYYDGAPVDTLALALSIAEDSRDLTIGADTPGYLEIFYGKMDDVRLYSRALSDADIAELYGGPTGVSRTPFAPEFSIGHAVPNPTSGEASVDFVLGTQATIELTVYDVAGRRIRGLRAGALPAGRHVARWDGRDDAGRVTPSGVYFFRLRGADARVVSSRVVRVR